MTICLFSQAPSFHFRILSSRTVHDGLKNQELNSSDSGIDHRGQASKGKIQSSAAQPCYEREEMERVWMLPSLDDLLNCKNEWSKQKPAVTCVLHFICALSLEIRFLHKNITPPAEDMWSWIKGCLHRSPVLWPVLRFVGFWLWEADLSGFSVNFIMVINKTNSNSKLLCVPDGKI